MNVLVAYQSRGGHTRKVAEAIATAVKAQGHHVVVKPVSEVHTVDVQTANALFIGTWVQGLILFGVRPAGASRWVPGLPALKGKPIGVFCTYDFNPRGALHALATMLQGQGANILGERAFRGSNPVDGAEQFVESVLKVA